MIKLWYIWDLMDRSKFTNKTTDELGVHRIFRQIDAWEKYRYEIRSEESNDEIS